GPNQSLKLHDIRAAEVGGRRCAGFLGENRVWPRESLADRIYSWQANANAMFEPQAVPTRVDDLFSRVILRNSREMVQRTLLMSNYFSQNGVRITVTVRVCPQICGWEKY